MAPEIKGSIIQKTEIVDGLDPVKTTIVSSVRIIGSPFSLGAWAYHDIKRIESPKEPGTPEASK